MIKNIIFDFGGVILIQPSNVVPYILNQLFPNSSEAEKIWKENTVALNEGQMTSRQLLEKIKIATQDRKSVEELLYLWKKVYKKEADTVNTDLLAYIHQLRKSYKVYLFTDTIDVHDEINRDRHLYDQFDHAFKSNEEKLSKQAGEKAFLNVLEKIGAMPEECVFIDDLQKNIDQAKVLGIQGILYTNLEQLKIELSQIFSLGVEE